MRTKVGEVRALHTNIAYAVLGHVGAAHDRLLQPYRNVNALVIRYTIYLVFVQVATLPGDGLSLV